MPFCLHCWGCSQEQADTQRYQDSFQLKPFEPDFIIFANFHQNDVQNIQVPPPFVSLVLSGVWKRRRFPAHLYWRSSPFVIVAMIIIYELSIIIIIFIIVIRRALHRCVVEKVGILSQPGGSDPVEPFFKTQQCRAPLRYPVHLYRRRLHCMGLHPHGPLHPLLRLLLLLLLRGIQGIQGIHVEYRRPTTKWYQPGWSVQPGESTRVNKAATFRGGEREREQAIQAI